MTIDKELFTKILAWITNNRLLHTVVAVLVAYWCLQAVVVGIGGTLFGVAGGEDQTAHTGLRHLSDMLVFKGVALALVGGALYLMRYTVLQAIFLPWFDELMAMAKKWRAGEKPTQAEATMALGWAIMTGSTVLGALIAIALVATPL